MKPIFLIIAFPLCCFFQSCNDSQCVRGTGPTNEYEIDVAEFDKISLIGIMTLNVTQGSEQKVTIISEPEIFGELTYIVNNQHLKFDFDADCIDTDFGVQVNITVPDINYVSIEGEGKVTSVGDLTLDQLKIEIYGAGDVNLSGSANQISYLVEGTGEVDNFDISTASTFIDVQGAGNLNVTCSEQLNIEVEGSANVAYKGTPQITQEVSGILNITKAN